jgi:hypothetical protein
MDRRGAWFTEQARYCAQILNPLVCGLRANPRRHPRADSPPRGSFKTLIRRKGRRNVRSPMLGSGISLNPALETPS